MKRTVIASREIVSLAEAKAHIQGLENITAFDDFISVLITAAREVAEQFLWRIIARSEIDVTYDAMPSSVILPAQPIIDITSITYTNTAGQETTLPSTAYKLDDNEPSTLTITTPSDVGGNVIIKFVAGYDEGDDPEPEPEPEPEEPLEEGEEGGEEEPEPEPEEPNKGNVPAAFKVAIMMMVRTWFDNRDNITNRTVNEMPKGSEYILRNWRCFKF